MPAPRNQLAVFWFAQRCRAPANQQLLKLLHPHPVTMQPNMYSNTAKRAYNHLARALQAFLILKRCDSAENLDGLPACYEWIPAVREPRDALDTNHLNIGIYSALTHPKPSRSAKVRQRRHREGLFFVRAGPDEVRSAERTWRSMLFAKGGK